MENDLSAVSGMRPGSQLLQRLLLTAAAIALLPLPASAGPLTITNSTSNPVKTSTGDGSGPGDITIDSGGSINVSSGIPLTIDSDNAATINGTITHEGETNSTAVLVDTLDAAGQPRTLISGFTLGGVIAVQGPDEKDLESVNAGNFGVRFSGNGTFRGNVTTVAGSTISVGGSNSYGIFATSRIEGDVNIASSIVLNGNDAIGARFDGPITGTVTFGGQVAASALNAGGLVYNGDIGGAFLMNGSVGTGARATFDNNGRIVDPLQGGSALIIRGGVGGGILFNGNGLTETQEQTITADTTAPADTLLYTEAGNSATVVIAPTGPGGDMVIGRLGAAIDPNQAAFAMKGQIQSTTTEEKRSTLALVISGSADGQPVRNTTFLGDIRNEAGNIDSVATDATAIGIQIGPRVTAPRFVNTGEIVVRAQDKTEDGTTGAPGAGGGNAFGMTIAAGSSISRFENPGSFLVDARGATFSAFGILDESGSMTSFDNAGAFSVTVRPSSTGRAVGVDFGRATGAFNFRNTGTFVGSVRLGSGNDTLTAFGGTMTGDIDMGAGNAAISLDHAAITGNFTLGAGNHSVVIDNASTLNGGISRGAGTAQIDIYNSKISVPGGKFISATNAQVIGVSSLDFAIDGQTTTVPLLGATNRLVIGSSVKISTRLAGLVRQSSTFTLFSANELVMEVPLSQITSSTGSYIYSFSTRFSPTNRNVVLLDVTRKSAAQLGLGPNMGATYENALESLSSDNALFSLIALNPDKPSFEAVMQQLVPDSSDSALYAAQNTQNMAHGVIRRRLAGIPRTLGPNPTGEYPSFWLQQLGSYGKRDAEGEDKGYTFYAAGLAAGWDFKNDNGLKFGTSLSRTWSLPDERGTRDRPLRIVASQLDFYGRHQNGANFTQAIFGAGYDQYRSRRRVILDDPSNNNIDSSDDPADPKDAITNDDLTNDADLIREPTGKWSGYHFGGTIDTGTTARMGAVKISPYARVSYIRVREKSYAETDGGAGVNLSYDARTQDSLRGGVGFSVARRFTLMQDTGIEAEFRGDYARAFSQDAPTVSARFASGGTTFTTTGPKSGKNILTGGLSVGVRDIFTAFTVDYDAEYTGDFLGHTVAATFRFRF